MIPKRCESAQVLFIVSQELSVDSCSSIFLVGEKSIAMFMSEMSITTVSDEWKVNKSVLL